MADFPIKTSSDGREARGLRSKAVAIVGLMVEVSTGGKFSGPAAIIGAPYMEQGSEGEVSPSAALTLREHTGNGTHGARGDPPRDAIYSRPCRPRRRLDAQPPEIIQGKAAGTSLTQGERPH